MGSVEQTRAAARCGSAWLLRPVRRTPPTDLVRRAAERGIGTVALTGRDTVPGSVRFVHAALAAGIRPVFGVDVAVAVHP
ncbi:PHP domain-containing protein [Streptomyces cyaneofuscatus]|uniref:PHP domain-containing protein n=1 Tax=Streptomyces cyaneofuscatus TaxID=66883 RepID=UPI00332626B3